MLDDITVKNDWKFSLWCASYRQTTVTSFVLYYCGRRYRKFPPSRCLPFEHNYFIEKLEPFLHLEWSTLFCFSNYRLTCTLYCHVNTKFKCEWNVFIFLFGTPDTNRLPIIWIRKIKNYCSLSVYSILICNAKVFDRDFYFWCLKK